MLQPFLQRTETWDKEVVAEELKDTAEADSGKGTALSVEAKPLKRGEGSSLAMQRTEESAGFLGTQTFQFLHCFCSALRKPHLSRLQEVEDS